MMKTLRYIGPAAMLLALSVPAAAQQLPVLGQGNISCGSWLDRRAGATGDADTMVAWVLGYITAFNQYAGDPQADVTGGQEPPEITGWLDRFCQENASANLYQASAALIEELRRNTVQ